MQHRPNRILIFNVNWLGDVLFSTAAIRNIRYHFPESFIACAVPSRCAIVLEANPHLDEVITFDEKTAHRGIFAKIRFIRKLKDKRFDTVFLLHRSLTRALICGLAGIKERIGYSIKGRGFLLTKKIAPLPYDAGHRIDYYLNLITQAGIAVRDRYTEFFIGEGDLKEANDFLMRHGVKKEGLLIGINAGGNWDPKRWPKENWARLADCLVSECGATVVITGGQKDVALANNIRTMMKQPAIIAAGQLSLKGFAALSKSLAFFISADTGPLHIANAVGTKNIIALFGPTSSVVTGPYPLDGVRIIHKDIGCTIPCYEVACPDNRCMKAIGVEDVLKQVREAMLAGRSVKPHL